MAEKRLNPCRNARICERSLKSHDKERYPDIICANENGEAPYYTNSSHLPVGFSDDVFEALDIQDELQTLYTSGTVFHTFLGEKLPDWKAAASLVRSIAQNYRLPYYTISPTYSICKTHGYLSGEQYQCPICKEKTEVWSRITGYYRPVQNWNEGKAQEFKDRTEYKSSNQTFDESCHQLNASKTIQTLEKNKKAERLLKFLRQPAKFLTMIQAVITLCGFLISAFTADLLALWIEYGILQAPTLLILNGEQKSMYCGLEKIIKYIHEQ